MSSKVIFGVLFALAVSFPTTPLSAACLNPPMTPEAISSFKSNPGRLVSPDSDTRTIEGTTRDLAGSDASLAAELVNIARETTPRFRTAIAAGLAQAAIACSTVDQKASLVIQEAVASFEDGQFQSSFAAVAGDLSTAATEAAGAYAVSSAGSVVVTNPVTGTEANTLPGGGGVLSPLLISAPASAISGNGRTAASAVSPTR